MRAGNFFLNAFVALAFFFLLLPIVVVVAASFATSPLLVFPPSGFTLRWYYDIRPTYVDALKVSLLVALGTTALATLIGTPAALALVRGQFPGRKLLNVFCLSPLMVPTLVIGLAAFRLIAALPNPLGGGLGGTIIGVILAQTAFTIPFVIRAAIAGQAHFEMSVEEAALSLGSPPVRTFFKVTFPMIAPGIVSGAVFAFLASFDDLPVALFVGGGDATTLPVAIFSAIEFSLEADVMAVASIVIFGSVAIMLLVDRLIGLNRFFGTDHN